jgi:hypothetical protein
MVQNITVFAIAPQLEDEFNRASMELEEHLEASVNAIASRPPLPPSFNGIREGLHDVVLDAAQSFKGSAFKALEQLIEMAQLLLRMKTDLKKQEYQILLKELGYTPPKANKLIGLAKTFDGFNLWQLAGISINTLFTLCSKTYADLVEQLRGSTAITTEAVEMMMKAARPPRKPKQRQPESTVELARDVSGGGRHLNFQLYDDELITKITHSAEAEQITNQQAVAIAFKRSEKLEIVQQELVDVVTEVRDVQIEMQRELVEKDQRISELEKLLASTPSATLTTVEIPTVPCADNITWEDVAQLVNCDRALFLDTMKTWTVEQKELLPGLLAEHIEEHGPECLDEIKWIPDKLRDAALKQLSFAVEKIIGPSNLVEEPKFECFYGCKFVSLRDFGTRAERWLFEAPDGRKFPIFGRSEFAVNRF